jgi:phosphoribosylanthranilate isomerase
MSGPLLKICGLTNIPDLRLAQRVGADFLGMVVDTPRSPRSLSVPQARVLAALDPARIVAVTVSDDPGRLAELAHVLHPRALQLHGPEAVALAQALRGRVPCWVAVGVPAAAGDTELAVEEALAVLARAAEAGVEMAVLDTSVKGETGGTGRVSDWTMAARIVARSPLPVLLAGGLGPGNAAEALAVVKPAGLDASSRLEAVPGLKDARRVRDFAAAVKG